MVILADEINKDIEEYGPIKFSFGLSLQSFKDEKMEQVNILQPKGMGNKVQFLVLLI